MTETFNLALPVYPHPAYGRDRRYLSKEQVAAYGDIDKQRKDALLALVQAIAPELAVLTPYTGAWRELFSFPLGPNGSNPSLAIREIKTGQIEVQLDNGYRHKTFRRVKVDPKTGAIDPRFVEAVRELVAEAKAIVESNAAAKVRAASDAERKATAFAHAREVVSSLGLAWAYGQDPGNRAEGDVDLDGYGHRVTIRGREMGVTLTGLDVDKLPALLAFVRSLKGNTP